MAGNSLSGLSHRELKNIAKDNGIFGYYFMSKDALIKKLCHQTIPYHYYLLILFTFPIDLIIWIIDLRKQIRSDKKRRGTPTIKAEYAINKSEIGLRPKWKTADMEIMEDNDGKIDGIWVENLNSIDPKDSFQSKMRTKVAFLGKNVPPEVYISVAKRNYTIYKCKKKKDGGPGGYYLEFDK